MSIKKTILRQSKWFWLVVIALAALLIWNTFSNISVIEENNTGNIEEIRAAILKAINTTTFNATYYFMISC